MHAFVFFSFNQYLVLILSRSSLLYFLYSLAEVADFKMSPRLWTSILNVVSITIAIAIVSINSFIISHILHLAIIILDYVLHLPSRVIISCTFISLISIVVAHRYFCLSSPVFTV